MTAIVPIVMAGGSGTRLWPLSRALYPKQFLSLDGKQTMLQQTLTRLSGMDEYSIHCKDSILICNEEHRFIVAEQLRAASLNSESIILEPVGRNTAPAIALAALQAQRNGEDPILLILAADHLIQNISGFHESIANALVHALEDKLVTFGIEPSSPETGYGYIQRGDSLSDAQGNNESLGYSVMRFVEKPDRETAQAYLDSGEYYWNSGMFMFRASRYLEELKRFNPEMLECCEESLRTATEDLDFLRLNKEAFLQCPDDSIDYAVMEKTKHAVVVPMNAEWNDVGSWSSLWDVKAKDDCGNVLNGDVVAHKTEDSYIHSEGRLVTTLGVQNLVVVETKDAVLVAQKDSVQDVKAIIQELKDQGRNEWYQSREVYRPWGIYDSVDSGERYQVKRITVKPGAKLSVQMHYHRAEHWIVVSGTAKVTLADDSFLVTENESTYIPVGSVHALENPGSIPLELIEVQSGSYLGEDDIVRFSDRYGRS
ncbi:mannose-1-phosphate guanylyltransferase/mannose-6-phosphate isomerase [Litoribrevibacter albus]|uniref:mannose-1-phosphate guanylyltransferase n=1 Tax=Litoribrevibacter albus TaxID=1473156 RepID=A0AA37S8D4_9GAMM|nr:mannose-1-phosphate guanylyltransferase/mannose-6-phosphate isomerase [Litoribrevibacter albus]GLQ30293.1 mannose-1-phosphate guanyltransferase [Litoribrevibacter albus]